MKLSEVIQQLKAAKTEAAKSTALSNEERYALEDLIYELDRLVDRRVFDALSELRTIPDPDADLRQLEKLTTDLKKENVASARRGELIGQIVGIAKLGLKAAGIPLPA